MNAIYVFVGDRQRASSLVWALLHLLGGHDQRGSMNALNFFVESSTMGTILVLVVYFLANLALPFYYRKFRPAEFNVAQARRAAGARHDRDRRAGLLPVQARSGRAVRLVPVRGPGDRGRRRRSTRSVLNRRDPGLGERAGSIVADE